MLKYLHSLLILCVFAVFINVADATTHIRGLHIYGGKDETHLPIVLLPTPEMDGIGYAGTGDKYITVDFDADSPLEPVLKVMFVHCSRYWQEDQEFFDDNFMNLQTTNVQGKRADPRIRQYAYHYSLHFPDAKKQITFEYSGNYKVKILDGDDTVAVGKFYVADQLSAMQLAIYNEMNNAFSPPKNVHNVQVSVTCAPEILVTSLDGLDVIQSHRIEEPYRVDQNDTSGNSQITVSGTYINFTAMNIVPGNTYRVIDITDPGIFAPSTFPTAFSPEDILRAGLSGVPDYNGSEILNKTPATYADYIPIAFRLDADGERSDNIFIVGAFSDWLPKPRYMMKYAEKTNDYSCVVWLKRGIYDYQYVIGRLDEVTGQVTNQSWTALEGNSWGAPRVYTALLYYHDDRFGGIDRIVGCMHN